MKINLIGFRLDIKSSLRAALSRSKKTIWIVWEIVPSSHFWLTKCSVFTDKGWTERILQSSYILHAFSECTLFVWPYLYGPICMNSTLFYDVNSWILRWKELFNWYSKRWESYIWIEMSEHLMDWTEITRITCMIIGNKVGFITGNCGKLDIYHRCRSFSRY